MSSITADFAEALATVQRPASFFIAGTEQILAPGLAVEGVGPVALPLLPVQAEQLIAAAERAPYGKGEDTITDLAVRRTWQIGADRVRITGRHWPDTIKAIITRLAEGLGVADPVEAELYKLLVYDQGSFFVPHRDTEKAPGMFATLILSLPSVSEGGALFVRHKDREARLDLRCEEPSDVVFAAFYADCVHEVLPVTAGYRLVLVYNLVRRGTGPLPEVPDYHGEQQSVAALLAEWAETQRSPDPDEDDPVKLIYPLEHAYTPAELGFHSLKGADAGIAPVVVAAAQRAGCDVHLALITIEENGIAEYNGDYRPRRGRYHDDDDDDDDEDDEDYSEFEVVEMSDRSAMAANWRRPDGEPSPLTELPVEDTEFSPPLSFDELEPDEEHFQEATGNEGASYERTYSRAALILWPADQLLAVINQGGLAVTLPFLADLTARWEAAGDATVHAQARQLATHMITGWQMDRWYPRRDTEPSECGRFLDLLRRLEDTAAIDTFLTALAGRHGFDAGDAAAIAAALLLLPADRAVKRATSVIEGASDKALMACGKLLSCLSALDQARAVVPARALVAALPGDQPRVPPQETWLDQPRIHPDFLVDLFTALGRLDPTLAAVAADHVLDWPATYDFDTVLIPAVGTLLSAPATADLAVVNALRDACVAHLDARIALPLEPPPDWRRDNTLGCNCKDCQALAAYLADPTQQVWVFAAAEPRRRHVESTIRNAKCDLDTGTRRRGSPHQLICTKNQASFDRRCAQRTNDLAERQRLTA